MKYLDKFNAYLFAGFLFTALCSCTSMSQTSYSAVSRKLLVQECCVESCTKNCRHQVAVEYAPMPIFAGDSVGQVVSMVGVQPILKREKTNFRLQASNVALLSATRQTGMQPLSFSKPETASKSEKQIGFDADQAFISSDVVYGVLWVLFWLVVGAVVFGLIGWPFAFIKLGAIVGGILGIAFGIFYGLYLFAKIPC